MTGLLYGKPLPKCLRDEAIKAEEKKALAALKRRVRQRDGGRCVACYKSGCDMHHILPKSMGGRDTDTNCVLLCRQCHTYRHAGLIRIFRDDSGHLVVERDDRIRRTA